MGKKLYFFNQQTLQYEKVKPTIKNRLMRLLSVVFTGVLFSGVVILIAYTFFNSPKELMQQREIEQFKLQTKILDEKLEILEKVADNLQDRDDNIYRVIFETEPVASEIRQAGIGGSDRYEKLKGYKNSDLLINTTKKLDRLSNRLYVQSTSYDEVFDMAKNMDQMTACIPAIQPISDKYKRRISSFYGYRIHPIYKRRIFHDGLDFSAPTGTEIYATGDGVVESASRSSYGYGNKITIDHGYGYKTVYAHMHKFKVRKGQKVSRGQVIGSVGNSGLSTSPHLHYEVLRNDRKVNPIYYFFNDLSPQEYEEIISSANSSLGGGAL
ncbi:MULTISPECIES: M23 family metallopeptidase [unclassified Lentimicrobium]|uniref:M23 family metallopeptidase n=1 Tax=unclassified Lentimicrobium TaxID=2677434 RepID=UPI0015560F87|nr:MULTISPECIES: M23 family metallopeptidase [unclassified Lentimicrobium]NPD45017.1 M23 family metallopeptidase [Lentimicrobium sp. S6]NPD86039.1 M23 family metallopeptidase [Lentimicrobium sp. L6]